MKLYENTKKFLILVSYFSKFLVVRNSYYFFNIKTGRPDSSPAPIRLFICFILSGF